MTPDEASADPAPVERLLDDLSRLRLEPHRVSLRYRVRLLLVALVMVLLPLLYLVAVGVLAGGLVMHLKDPPKASQLIAWIPYLGLATMGSLCVFFLVKPLFIRRAAETDSVPLSPGEAPDLECFVGLLARAVGAPGPRQIELDCSVNASASFAGGWRGVWDQELKLTIGLPLVAGLDLRSFAGVLAHELGHFSQRGGMRLAWFVMLVNEWFGRLVHSRDRWDIRLQGAAQSEQPAVKAFGFSAVSLVWLARQPLRLLMSIGRFVSGFALRQMEFDADGFEIEFAGSEGFRRTSREINLLNVGSAKALRLIGENLPDGSLPRNLPALARKQTEALSERVRAAVEEEMMASSARFALFKGAPASERGVAFFSTHPCDRERIEIAESYAAPGLVHSTEPASSLFDEFGVSAERISSCFYDIHFPVEAENCALVDNLRFNNTVRDREERFEACERFFDGRFTLARPLLFPAEDVRAVLRGVYRDDPDAASGMRRWLTEEQHVFEQYESAEEDLVTIARASELFQAGFKIRRKAFGLSRGLAALSDKQTAAAAQRDRALVRLAGFDHLSRRCLLGAATASLKACSPTDGTQTKRVLRALGAMSIQFPRILRLRRRVLAQRALLENITPGPLGRSLIERLQRNSLELSDLTGKLRKAFERLRYPFDHTVGKLSVSDYAMADTEDREIVMRSFRTAETMIERLFDLYFRLVGHLCQMAEEEGGR